MSDEYDDIKDLWYSWLFSRLHYLILTYLIQGPSDTVRCCLDVGCGTGFQTMLLALSGKDTIGIDISRELVGVARRKEPRRYLGDLGLFSSPFRFVRRYDRKLRKIASRIRGTADVGKTDFHTASATAIPFKDGQFDLINCCGSTLSLIKDYQIALSEMARVLRPGGYLVLEVENKYNVDLIWPALDSLLGGIIGFEQPLPTSFGNLCSACGQHLKTDFPFSTHDEEVDMKIWLFSSHTLQRQLDQLGLQVIRVEGIHCATNLVPSVLLDSPTPCLFLRSAFSLLSTVEEMTASLPVFRRLGCSTIFFCVKKDGERRGNRRDVPDHGMRRA